jgi:rubrerythrin
MSKTEDVIKALNEGKSTATIKEETGASEALISKCRTKLKAMEETPEKQPEPEEEPEPTDDELEQIINKIKIKPEDKYLTGKDKQQEDEEYTCMGCGHVWRANDIPSSCPSCKAEF